MWTGSLFSDEEFTYAYIMWVEFDMEDMLCPISLPEHAQNSNTVCISIHKIIPFNDIDTGAFSVIYGTCLKMCILKLFLL